MFNSVITDFIKVRIGSPKLNYGRLSWAWQSGSSAILKMDRDKSNLIDGILIINFGITTTGTNVPIVITDQVVNQIVYENQNAISQSLLSPFLYFVKGNQLQFINTVKCVYGFNYITVQGENK